MGLPLKFVQASEPTDIIWENRHFYPGFDSEIFCCRKDWKESRVCREILGYTFVIICLCLSFFFILYLASLEMKFAQVFPATNCEAVEETYGPALEEYAYYDYVFVSKTKNLPSSGCLQCFCTQQVEELGYTATVNTEYTGGKFANGTAYPDEPICYQYLKL